MYNITMEVLDNAEHRDVLGKGVFHDEGSTNIYGTNKELRWIATRGVVNDWAIYIENPYWDNTYLDEEDLIFGKIKRVGDKLPKYMCKKLLDVSDEALERYRQ